MTANTTVTRCHAKILEGNMRTFCRIRIFTYSKAQVNELKATRIEALPLVGSAALIQVHYQQAFKRC